MDYRVVLNRPTSTLGWRGAVFDRFVAAARYVRGPALDALDDPACARKTCRASKERLVRDWVRRGVFAEHTVLNTIAGALQTHAERHPEHRLCRECKAALTQAVDARRREAFAQLSATFGVANWPAA
ncbi:hypothetical protein PsYK624_163650 [Phanerochaete sordida]|uniref:Uncharacterized protein n=1 Tax=Phanerochaete sordida TaxID=48140 RepID=A0A9P3GQT1_9APHY|nr:hypothetical protein PsYK624_163650 [Phanerochaete sordida]